ncbi:hypothetical protein ACWT_0383 [Actinoplanes sp. SE50]|uniref:hypothetical protein n=1 Tax=unclassified Actinoplanes TaxID=2626549 RepID=UPI00023EC551|nr:MULTISPECIES: hypothetical protein [unclassified Actinoplanes]AEV81395.1 hypothetical protein ACPL_498 [Actinoplanes sp. SE50/110]ATO79798.1 hypothetical protein ACWT_0383 [Actinoplanes sp. SE50]SLL97200.1 hypothetical protein ACSP50_0397 [Actinoplanes sp. SE50/110]
MDRIADRIDQAAAELSTIDRRAPHLLPGPGAFGADDVGRPGRLGHRLHERWAAVLQARADEAAGLSGRLTDLAQSVRSTSRDYSQTDESVRHRLLRGL